MNILIVAVASLTTWSSSALQGRAEAKATDPAAVEARAMATLFDGVTLNKQQETAAKEIIKKENRAQLAIDGKVAGAWDRRAQLNRTRDSSLLALLKTRKDSATFEQNAGPLRPRGSMRRPR